jgi:N,N-dimethylformamidase
MTGVSRSEDRDPPVLLGYASRTSAIAGDQLDFMVSCDPPGKVAVRMVRLRCGLGGKWGPGEKILPIEGEPSGHYDVSCQPLYAGSYGYTDSVQCAERVTELTAAVWAYPTLFAGETRSPLARWTYPVGAGTTVGVEAEQGLLVRTDRDGPSSYSLALGQDGAPVFQVTDCDGQMREIAMEAPLTRNVWSLIIGRYRAGQGLRLLQLSRGLWVDERPRSASRRWDGGNALTFGDEQVLFGALTPGPPTVEARPSGLFSGKLDSPTVWHRELRDEELERLLRAQSSDHVVSLGLWSRWDLGAWADGERFPDKGGSERHGHLVNLPTRAVTGHRWQPTDSDFRQRQDAYGAVHFHPDDVGDVGWAPTFSWRVPERTPSGVYAADLRAGDARDLVWFVVRPADPQTRAPIVLVLPTLTYLAYANTQLPYPEVDERPPGYVRESDPRRRIIDTHPGLGRSLYDIHSDGSGVCYVSRLRPMPDNRPDFTTDYLEGGRHLAADLYLVDWLMECGFDFDVVTDEDLHRQGASLLEGYRVLLTGSHPEYATGPMLDALHTFSRAGGNLMYLGGNGFWCVSSLGGRDLHVMECRRGMAGSTIWRSSPGEVHHSTTGEPGGMWRFLGRSPNELTGLGCTAVGSGAAARGYRRLPDGLRPDAAFVFEGIARDEVIGEFGFASSGAAGDEIDRADAANGTPAHTLLLATARGFSDDYQALSEDIFQMQRDTGGRTHPFVRADMVLIPRGRRGAVFGVGSMTWTASLAHNGYQNNVARITANVLERFLESDGGYGERPRPIRDRESGGRAR